MIVKLKIRRTKLLANNGLGLESSSWECIGKQLSTEGVLKALSASHCIQNVKSANLDHIPVTYGYHV